MSEEIRLHARVEFVVNTYAADGAPAGTIGYVVVKHAPDAVEVEVSDPATGNTLAMVVVDPVALRSRPIQVMPRPQ